MLQSQDHSRAAPLPGLSPAKPASRPAPGVLPADLAGHLAAFARACRAAIRAVSLYPGVHPAVGRSVARLVTAAGRLAGDGRITLAVYPAGLAIEGRTAERPEPAIGALATLLHDRLVGGIGFDADAGADDWRALLLLLARAPGDLRAQGGIGRAWADTRREGFDLHEIDYADVLRERGGLDATWDRIIARCLAGEPGAFDEEALAALLEALQHAERFGELLVRLQAHAEATGATLGARAAALMRLLQSAVEAARAAGQASVPDALQVMADASAQLTPDLLLALVDERRGAGAPAWVASQIVDRLHEETVATFLARSVEAERGATERIAQAFEALVPERGRRSRLLDRAYEHARATPFGAEAGFDDLWREASRMLLSYSDAAFVSPEYARELTAARDHALEVERIADDPPDRIRAWLDTLSDAAVRELDRCLLLDLLRLRDDPAVWEGLATLALAEAERRLLLGELDDARQLVQQVAVEREADGRPGLRGAADAVFSRLETGPMARHIALSLRTADDTSLGALRAICLLVGPALVRPLAEALAVEEHTRGVRRLRELLLAFGAAGRQSVEQLKQASNPAVRRAAIDLLRVFGGDEALPELAFMLHDADPQVQREAVRAVVQIGSPAAHAVLERALLDPAVARDTLVQQIIGLRDQRAIPALCRVLTGTRPRGRLVAVHRDVIEALGGLGTDTASIEALAVALRAGDWWAPWRTAALRQAAARALRRLGSPAAAAVLGDAAATGPAGVRRVARAALAHETPRGPLS